MKLAKEQRCALLDRMNEERRKDRRNGPRFNVRDTVTWQRGKDGEMLVEFGNDEPIATTYEQGLWWAQMLSAERELEINHGERR